MVFFLFANFLLFVFFPVLFFMRNIALILCRRKWLFMSEVGAKGWLERLFWLPFCAGGEAVSLWELTTVPCPFPVALGVNAYTVLDDYEISSTMAEINADRVRRYEILWSNWFALVAQLGWLRAVAVTLFYLFSNNRASRPFFALFFWRLRHVHF